VRYADNFFCKIIDFFREIWYNCFRLLYLKTKSGDGLLLMSKVQVDII
jgi:hypothetical protein